MSRHKTVKAENRNLNTAESNRQALVTQANAYCPSGRIQVRCDVGRGRGGGGNKRSSWLSQVGIAFFCRFSLSLSHTHTHTHTHTHSFSVGLSLSSNLSLTHSLLSLSLTLSHSFSMSLSLILSPQVSLSFLSHDANTDSDFLTLISANPMSNGEV